MWKKTSCETLQIFWLSSMGTHIFEGMPSTTTKALYFIGYEESVKAYRLMDPETHEIFIERNVHFEESLPSLSSNPLHTSYIVETDSDNSDSDSTSSLVGDPSNQ